MTDRSLTYATHMLLTGHIRVKDGRIRAPSQVPPAGARRPHGLPGADGGCAMRSGVEKRAGSTVAGSLGVASMGNATGVRSRAWSTMSPLLVVATSAAFHASVVAIAREYPICHRLSLLRERRSPVAGHRAAPPRESFRQRRVNVSIAALPRRSVRAGCV